MVKPPIFSLTAQRRTKASSWNIGKIGSEVFRKKTLCHLNFHQHRSNWEIAKVCINQYVYLLQLRSFIWQCINHCYVCEYNVKCCVTITVLQVEVNSIANHPLHDSRMALNNSNKKCTLTCLCQLIDIAMLLKYKYRNGSIDMILCIDPNVQIWQGCCFFQELTPL